MEKNSRNKAAFVATISLSLLFFILIPACALIRYIQVTIEIEKSPVIYNLSDEHQEIILNCLQLNIPDIPENTQIVSLQYFPSWRERASAWVVIKTDNSFLGKVKFHDIDRWADADTWTDTKVEMDYGRDQWKPYIIVDGKRAWPIKHTKNTENDPMDYVHMTLFSSSDGYAWLSISLKKDLVGFDKLVRQAVGKETSFWGG